MNAPPSLYAGRWVARLRGQIIAQGFTAEEAARAAQQSRHKEKPEILFMLPLPPLVQTALDALPAEQEIALVGGAVRDLLLERECADYDFVVPAHGIETARKMANALGADFLPLDAERDTGRALIAREDGTRLILDIAVYRGASLEEDLRARDFTINAIAFDLRRQALIDPLNGSADLRAKTIRACAETAFTDDPVRILRAVRQAISFEFKIELNTRAWLKQAAPLLPNISAERLRDELFKMLKGKKSAAAIRALDMLGALSYLLPELTALKGVQQPAPHTHDVWEHTLAVLDALEQILSALRVGYDAEQTKELFTGLLGLRLGRYRKQIAKHFSSPLNIDRPHRGLLFFAALYHDVNKPQTRSVDENGRIRFFDHDMQGAAAAAERLRAFNLSAKEIQRVEVVIQNHMRIHAFASRLEREGQTPSRKAIYRFFRDSGEAALDLILLGLADARATYTQNLTIETWSAYLDIARLLLENYFERPEEIIAPPRLLNGDELMRELNAKPGKRIGELLEAIRESQAAGKIHTREEALAFARAELQKEETA
ncbi:MAG: HD domain-containing protein [Anaerolineales bacterium]